MKKSFLVAVAGLMMVAVSCQKEKTNHAPTIRFTQPDSLLVVTHDTSLVFVAEPEDVDGNIIKVEFFINEAVVSTDLESSYVYEWLDAKLENAGNYRVRAVAYDNDGATGEDEIQIEIFDYREKFLGDFRFTVINESWSMGQPNTYDTSVYAGIIRRFDPADSIDDLYYIQDDINEVPDTKVTIIFGPSAKITSVLDTAGALLPKGGYHYWHSGGFTTTDSISFSVGGLGGLGAGNNYYVTGVKQ
ncbi:MAG: hypothetical protein KBC43_13350 [Bacteroidales bacterium]|nr:hypothetical protein [Bacteroidales bacterium]